MPKENGYYWIRHPGELQAWAVCYVSDSRVSFIGDGNWYSRVDDSEVIEGMEFSQRIQEPQS